MQENRYRKHNLRRSAELQFDGWYRTQSSATQIFFQDFASCLDYNKRDGALELVQDTTSSLEVALKPEKFVSFLAKIVTKLDPDIVPGQTFVYAQNWAGNKPTQLDVARFSVQQTYQQIGRYMARFEEEGTLTDFLKEPEEFLPQHFYDSRSQCECTAEAINTMLEVMRHKTEIKDKHVYVNEFLQHGRPVKWGNSKPPADADNIIDRRHFFGRKKAR